MKMKIFATWMALAALTVASGAFAAEPPNFDFNGYAIIPAGVGGTLTLRSVLTNNGVVPTPIPLDFSTQQHTIVVPLAIAVTRKQVSVALEACGDIIRYPLLPSEEGQKILDPFSQLVIVFTTQADVEIVALAKHPAVTL